jgi:hypothetical protein
VKANITTTTNRRNRINVPWLNWTIEHDWFQQMINYRKATKIGNEHEPIINWCMPFHFYRKLKNNGLNENMIQPSQRI